MLGVISEYSTTGTSLRRVSLKDGTICVTLAQDKAPLEPD